MSNKRIQARDIYNACKTHGEIIDKIQEALESRDTIAALRSEIANYETARQEDSKRLEHRFVTCTWCGWRLDYEADGKEAAYATANEHALYCKADPRTAQLATVTAEREALRQSNETLKVSGMDDIGGGIAKLIEHNTALLKVGKG